MVLGRRTALLAIVLFYVAQLGCGRDNGPRDLDLGYGVPQQHQPRCGNGKVDRGEECDPPDGQTCSHECKWPGLPNVCPEITWMFVAPLQTNVGRPVRLEVNAQDLDGDELSFTWQASDEGVEDQHKKKTEFVCSSAGKTKIKVKVTDSVGCSVSSEEVSVKCKAD